MKLNKLLIIAAAAFAVAGIAQSGTANAGTARQGNSVVVKFGDLNLESTSGIRRLHKRIRNAAESVCSALDTRVLGLRDDFETCVDKAVADSVATIDNPNLTSYHAGGKVPVFESNPS